MVSSNLSSSSNSTQGMDCSYYGWCTDYPIAVGIFSAVSLISFLLGFPASLWVLHELVQRRRKKSTSDIFILNLAVLDLIFTAHVPFNVCNFMIWQFREVQFFLNIFFSLSLNGRPLFMACTCWDCYMAVVYPIVYKASKTLHTIKMSITIIIYLNIAGCGLVEGTATWLITTPFIGLPLFVALPVITFCDISVLRALRRPEPTGNYNVHPQKKRALHIIICSFIMTLVVYLPPTMIFSLGMLMPFTEAELSCCINCYGVCFSTAGCVIMSIFCLVSLGKLDMITKCWKK